MLRAFGQAFRSNGEANDLEKKCSLSQVTDHVIIQEQDIITLFLAFHMCTSTCTSISQLLQAILFYFSDLVQKRSSCCPKFWSKLQVFLIHSNEDIPRNSQEFLVV